jgi:hypothetical protein
MLHDRPDQIGSKALGIVPVAPASRSAISVIDSSPSNGPFDRVPALLDQPRNLAAAPGTSILK